MTSPPVRCVIHEINVFVWLNQLSSKYRRRIDLGNVPNEEWDHLASRHYDAVWLMGVWQRSPKGREIALADTAIAGDCVRVLPDCSAEDVVGSAYSIRSYTVDERLGNLAAARAALAERGLKLILDFVPNHVAIDHQWVTDHRGYLIQGTVDDLKGAPGSWFEVDGDVMAHGRDPYFPAWTDTVQLNAFSPQLRKAAIDTLCHVASQCDGVRCDMAMLLLNDVFAQTWKGEVGGAPPTEYWADVIGAVKQNHPDFLFIAEAYWNREWDLQQLGFNYCYDKRLYDRLVHEDASSVRAHLMASLEYQDRLIRFLENHDEARAAAAFPPDRHKAAAAIVATLPGATLYHEGQECGHQVRVPVQLGRGPNEPCNENLANFYSRLGAVAAIVRRDPSEWTPSPATGWPDNPTAANLLSWCWRSDSERYLIAVNFSAAAAQGRLALPWHDLADASWRLMDLLNPRVFERYGRELQEQGLYIDLEPWDFYVFRVERMN